MYCEAVCKAQARYKKLTEPSWKRALRHANTPKAAQAEFEEEAIDKEAKRLYHETLRRIAQRRGEIAPV